MRKVKTKNGQEVLRRLKEYLDNSFDEPIKVLCGFWKDQQDAITYQEIRKAIADGTIKQETINLWRQDYSVLVSNKLRGMWKDAIVAGSSGQPILDDAAFEFNTQTPGILNWINERGAEFVTACTKEQKDAIAALLTKKMREEHTVDELSRLIRPCIGLTEGDAKAAARFYDNIVSTYKEEHPRMKLESIRKKALDATQKYAERKHRQRALTIAQTESAFAYNRGADEGIRQAQAGGYLGIVKKRWSTSGDDAVCSICAALDGVEIEMDDNFDFNGRLLFVGHKLTPPAHPRCACAVEYIESMRGLDIKQDKESLEALTDERDKIRAEINDSMQKMMSSGSFDAELLAELQQKNQRIAELEKSIEDLDPKSEKNQIKALEKEGHLSKEKIMESLPEEWRNQYSMSEEQTYGESFTAKIHAWCGNGYAEMKDDLVIDRAINLTDAKWEKGDLYRGMSIPSSTLEEISVDGTIQMKGLSSWSSDLSPAMQFATTEASPVLLIDKTSGKRNALSIATLSDRRWEKEVLYGKDQKFVVKNIAVKEVEYGKSATGDVSDFSEIVTRKVTVIEVESE